MILYLSKLFLCFIIFSFIGWFLEVLYGIYKLKKFVNRGFLMGPLCPIYGISCVIMYLIFSQIKNPIILFLASALFCSIIEYVASYILEKIFKVRWWDYDYMKFNINGRICLEMVIPFGLLGFISTYYIVPFVLSIINRLPIIYIYIITLILLLLLITDVIVSILIITKFKKNGAKSQNKDNTIEITEFVKSSINTKINKK